MRKLLSILVIFLLLFTYALPAYADPRNNESEGKDESLEELPVIEGMPDEAFDVDFEVLETRNEPSTKTNGNRWGHKPEAKDVEISGDPFIDGTLEVSYTFYDKDQDEEHSVGSLIAWYIDGNFEKYGYSNTLGVKTLEVDADMVGKEVKVVVVPLSSRWPHWGEAVWAEITILEANLWITVDDGYELYVDGDLIGSDPADSDDSWATIDYYYIDPAVYSDDILIAVKGSDQDGGLATISGFVLGYKEPNGKWVITDENWRIFYNYDDTPPAAYDDGSDTYEWYEEGYRSDDWMAAHIITELDSHWPVVSDHDYLGESEAKWIWSNTYKVSGDQAFDSPVYFRSVLQEYHEVRFLDAAGENFEVKSVENGQSVSEPETSPTKDGHIFKGWSLEEDPENYEAYIFELEVTEDLVLYPHFTEEHEVTFSVSSGMGTINATVDSLAISSGAMIEEGKNIIFTATPSSGYEISDWLLDDASLGSSATSYTVSGLSDDTDVKVVFEETVIEEPTEHEVTFSVSSGMGTINATVDSLAISSGAMIEEGKNIIFTATPSSGYEISDWLLDDVSLGSSATSYTVLGLSDDTDVKVVFEETVIEEPTEHEVTFSVSSGMGTINATVDSLGISSGAMIEEGKNIVFTATPSSGYEILDWLLDDVSLGSSATSYTVSDLSADTDVKVVFEETVIEEPTEYRVTFSVLSGMGIIEAIVDSLAINSGDMVGVGEDIVFTATPNAGYEISDWLLNNVSLESTTTSQAVVNLSADTDVKVSFTGPPVETNFYTVNFSTPGNGSINANVGEGSIATGDSVEEGSQVDFIASPNSGYRVDYWRVDGTIVNSTETTYSISSLESDVTVEVIFEVIPTTTTTTGGGGGGTTRTTSTVNAVSDRFTIVVNEVLEIETSELMANDDNVDSFESVQSADNGTVSLDGTTVTFTPDTDFIGRAYFNYTVEGDGDTDNGLVIIDVVEGVEIDDDRPPLGGGDPNAFVIINPDVVPLGIIDYSMPYIIGYPDKTFGPYREVTRAEMATIFARILSLDLSNAGEPLYDDVSKGDWYYEYVQAVTRAGLFNGYDGKLFRPDRSVSHAEIAVAFSRYWELKNIAIETNGDSYTDIEGHWAQEMINRLYNAGISASYPDGRFKPDAFTTRTELVVMVNRSLNRAERIREASTFRDVLRSFWGFGAIEAATGYQEPESVQLDE